MLCACVCLCVLVCGFVFVLCSRVALPCARRYLQEPQDGDLFYATSANSFANVTANNNLYFGLNTSGLLFPCLGAPPDVLPEGQLMEVRLAAAAGAEYLAASAGGASVRVWREQFLSSGGGGGGGGLRWWRRLQRRRSWRPE
jgi:hypothetical protein